MTTNKMKKFSYIAVAICFFMQSFIYTACSDWTEFEAESYYELPDPLSKDLRYYYNSPHKKMFGWFGNWAGKGASMQYALSALPDSVDFVSLWLCWGNLTPAQQEDLKEFQARGSKALFCWRAGDIGDNLTPGGNDSQLKKEFWGIEEGNLDSYVEAAKKYALAIVDSCNKYNVDGFDYDIEDQGTLMDFNNPVIPNTFLRTLREEFNKTGKMLVVDIPGDTWWLSYYRVLENDVIESLDHIIWQTYGGNHAFLDNFFTGNSGSVQQSNPAMFEVTMKKSIITATFEQADLKYIFEEQATYHPACGIEHAGNGAYHIEYDYTGNPDYPTVRAAITKLNPPINK